MLLGGGSNSVGQRRITENNTTEERERANPYMYGIGKQLPVVIISSFAYRLGGYKGGKAVAEYVEERKTNHPQG